MDLPLESGLSTLAHLHLIRRDDIGLSIPPAPGLAEGDLAVPDGGELEGGAPWQIGGGGLSLKDVLAPAQELPSLSLGLQVDHASQDDQQDLILARPSPKILKRGHL